MTTTDTMRHLSAIGNGPPLVVFVWLKAAGQPVLQNWLEAMTDLSDKTVAKALAKLAELQYIEKRGDGWAITTAQQGVLGDVLAALPGERDGNSVSGSLEEPTDCDIRPGNRVESFGDGISDSIPYGVGVGLTDLKQTDSDSVKQQHQHGAQDGNSVSPEDARRAEALLSTLGCWDNRIGPIVAGLHPTRGVGIVLGWIAYARDPENGIYNPAAVIAGHLEKSMAPASKWVPPRICGTCFLAEGMCACGTMNFHYPPDFDELAFEAPPAYDTAAWAANRWRCELCGGHPCQCESEIESDAT